MAKKITLGCNSLAVAIVAATLMTGCASTKPGFGVPFELDETPIAREEVPPAAMATLLAMAGDSPLIAFEREDRGAFIAYVGEWMHDGMKKEATVLSDGALLETESDLSEVEIATMAPAVQAQASRWRSEGYIVEFARRELVLYDMKIISEGSEREKEYILLPSGDVLTDSK